MSRPAPRDSGIRDEPALNGASARVPSFPRDSSVFDEPAAAPRARDDISRTSDEVWEEPILMPEAAPPSSGGATYRALVREKWRTISAASRVGALFLMLAVSGFFAIACAFFGEFRAPGLFSLVAVAVVAPLVEELAKVACPLFFLEKSPYRFFSGREIIFLCAVSGLIFAAVENFLYIYVYCPDAEPEFARFRWIVCTVLHIACATVSGLGLRRAWLLARAEASNGRAEIVCPYLITAAVIHGFYNLVATLSSFFEASF